MFITALVTLAGVYLERRGPALGFGALSVVLFGLTTLDVLKSREARDHVQARMFAAVCAEMSAAVFEGNAARTRFTLFIEPRSRPGVIVPWYRYSEGTTDPIAAASASRAEYRAGEGVTGKAWATPQKLMLGIFPKFTSAEEFRRYYAEQLGIRPEVVRDLNEEYMSQVGAVFAYGFIDNHNRVVGVLSLDIQAPAEQVDGALRLGGVDFDANGMFLILRSVRNVLIGFGSQLERTNR